jgi:trehalose 6-phosphate phosphatase
VRAARAQPADLLAPEQTAVLDALAARKPLLAFDFDGTLAPIVEDPASAHPDAETLAALKRAAALYPCAILTGRARRDLLARFHCLGMAELVGNHGVEWDPPIPQMGAAQRTVAAWAPLLEKALSGDPEVRIENKSFSLALHYRGAGDPKRALAAARSAAALCEGAEVSEGKCVLNLIPHGSPHKGDALKTILSRQRCDSLLFVGDDGNDEPAFQVTNSLEGLSVRVGRSEATSARYFLADQAHVKKLIQALVVRRERT